MYPNKYFFEINLLIYYKLSYFVLLFLTGFVTYKTKPIKSN